MIALGLDPSLTGFGWCVHNSGVVGPARVVAKGQLITNPRSVFVSRYIALRQALGEVIDAYPEIRAVGIESPTYGETWSSGAYGLFVYVNEAIFVRRKDVVYFDPGSVKMLAKMDPSIRKGKMFKSDMVDAYMADTGTKKRPNHNEADAYHVARFTARFWQLLDGEITEEDLTPSEFQSFARIHVFTKGKRVGDTLKMGAIFKEGQRFFRFSRLDSLDLDSVVRRTESRK